MKGLPAGPQLAHLYIQTDHQQLEMNAGRHGNINLGARLGCMVHHSFMILLFNNSPRIHAPWSLQSVFGTAGYA